MSTFIRWAANMIFGAAFILAAVMAIIALANLFSGPGGGLAYNPHAAISTIIPAIVILLIGALVRFVLLKIITMKIGRDDGGEG